VNNSVDNLTEKFMTDCAATLQRFYPICLLRNSRKRAKIPNVGGRRTQACYKSSYKGWKRFLCRSCDCPFRYKSSYKGWKPASPSCVPRYFPGYKSSYKGWKRFWRRRVTRLRRYKSSYKGWKLHRRLPVHDLEGYKSSYKGWKPEVSPILVVERRLQIFL